MNQDIEKAYKNYLSKYPLTEITLEQWSIYYNKTETETEENSVITETVDYNDLITAMKRQAKINAVICQEIEDKYNSYQASLKSVSKKKTRKKTCDWKLINKNHDLGTVTFSCQKCQITHSVKPYSTFNEEESLQLLRSQVPECGKSPVLENPKPSKEEVKKIKDARNSSTEIHTTKIVNTLNTTLKNEKDSK